MAKFRFFWLVIGLFGEFLKNEAKELKCTFKEKNNNGWRDRCVLYKKESIALGSESEEYTFTGLSTDQQNKVLELLFFTSDVAFIPQQSFMFFPNLNEIGFEDINMKVLNYDWLFNITKSFSSNIKTLYLGSNKIEIMDPRVVEIFNKFEVVHLVLNECVRYDFYKSKGDFEKFQEKLDKCFRNFVGDVYDKIQSAEKSIESVSKKLTNIDVLENKINEIDFNMTDLKSDLNTMKEDSNTQREDLSSLKEDFKVQREELNAMKGELRAIKNQLQYIIDNLQ